MPDAPHDGDAMVSMIERVALNADVPIDRLERLLDMKARLEDRARADRDAEARRAFFAALAVAQGEIPVVLKNRENTHTRSNYADLAAIEAQAMPVIRSHGFAVTGAPVPGAEPGAQRVRLTIVHKDGHAEVYEDDFPLDAAGSQGKTNKTPLQAKGSTITYGRRYLLCAAFNIATADNDGNASQPADDTISDDQFRELRDKIEEVGIDESIVLTAERVPDLMSLPLKRFAHVMARLNKTVRT